MNKYLLSLCLLVGINSFADIHHFKDILIGERAAGLGGAYIAISDDPTGIYYNPAGIVYSRENYISGSANGFHQSTKVYSDVYPGKNYTQQSQSLVPTFFGFTQSLSKKSKWGFAVVVPNAEYIDQDDTLTGLNDPTDIEIRRRLFRQDTTYLFGPAYSKEIGENLTFGISLFGFARTEKYLDVQWLKTAGSPNYTFQNIYMTRNAYGILPKIGFQWMPNSKISMGLTISKVLNVFGNGKFKMIDGPHSPGDLNSIANIKSSDDYAWGIPTTETISYGVAYFFDKKLLFALGADYFLYNPSYKEYAVQPVLNWSLGSEYYFSDELAFRLGIYSNNANTPILTASSTSRFDHVDMLGYTLSTSFYNSGSSITLGASYSSGNGKGDVTGSGSLNDLKQSALTLYLMGSYQL